MTNGFNALFYKYSVLRIIVSNARKAGRTEHEKPDFHYTNKTTKEIPMSLLNEAKELIEMSLKNEGDSGEYAKLAQAWLEKTAEAQQAHAAHHHEDPEEGATCSFCGFDLTCPSCGH